MWRMYQSMSHATARNHATWSIVATIVYNVDVEQDNEPSWHDQRSLWRYRLRHCFMNRQNIHTLNTLKCALPHTPTNTQMHTHPYKWTSDLCASLVSSLNLDILLLDSFHFFSRSAHAYVVHLFDCARLI